MGDLKLSKRKQEWRDRHTKDCTFLPIKDKQEFIGGKKIIMLYHNNKKAEGGFVDANWIERIEIHHIKDGKCMTYFDDERYHDALGFSEGWTGSTFIKNRPVVTDIRIQRDGGVSVSVWDDFKYENWQMAEISGLASPQIDKGEKK